MFWPAIKAVLFFFNRLERSVTNGTPFLSIVMECLFCLINCSTTVAVSQGMDYCLFRHFAHVVSRCEINFSY